METGIAYIRADLSRREKAGSIGPGDRQIIEAYFTDLKAKKGAADNSVVHWYKSLIAWTPYLAFSSATIDDVLRAKLDLEGREKKRNGRRTVAGKLKANTYRAYVYQLRRFFLWMIDKKRSAIPRMEIEEIEIPPMDRKTKNADMLLSERQIDTLINACGTSRDRFLVAAMFAGGCRPVELVAADWQDIRQDEYGLLLVTTEKTGIPRTVRLLEVTDFYAQWKTDYQAYGKPEGPNPVFVELRRPYRRITYQAIRDLFRRAVERAGIDKNRITPYLLRHSKITALLAAGAPEVAVKKQFWGSTKTEMLRTYEHLTTGDTDRQILAAAGIIKTDEQRRERKPKCSICSMVNPFGQLYCGRCGAPLTQEAATDEDGTLSRIRNTPLYKAIMADIKK